MQDESTHVPLVLHNGARIRVEATRAVRIAVPGGGERDVSYTPGEGSMEQDVSLIPADFDLVATALEGIAASLTKAIEKIAPKKTTVEFGLELQLESGGLTALIVKGSGKSNLTVTMEWS